MTTFAYFLDDADNSDHRTRVLKYADSIGVAPSDVQVFTDGADTLKVSLRERPNGGRLTKELQRGDRLLFAALEHIFVTPFSHITMPAKWIADGIEAIFVCEKDVCVVTSPSTIDLMGRALEAAGNMTGFD